jgi:ABC-type phosphate transport system permease subunit
MKITTAPEAHAGTRSRRPRKSHSLLAHGEPAIWATGGALVLALAMIIGLLVFILAQGLATFWPRELVLIRTVAGKSYLGEVTRTEIYRPEAAAFESLPADQRAQATSVITGAGGNSQAWMLRTGNHELTGTYFHWVSDFEIAEETRPEWAVIVEREIDGNFYGTPTGFFIDGTQTAIEPDAVWAELVRHESAVHNRVRQALRIREHDLGAVDRRENDALIATRLAEINHGKHSPEKVQADSHFKEVEAQCAAESEQYKAAIAVLEKENDRFQIRLVAADGQVKMIPLAQIVRAFPANRLGFLDKLGIYGSRWWEFISAQPRMSNTEGGVFPAIWGTMAMTLLMTLAVVPFGVLAALYLREYAKSGPIISTVRIAINNLAGVPSIVFGVFGLGFFCYLVGAFIDAGPRNIEVTPLPPASWWLGALAATLLGVAAFMAGLFGRGSQSSLMGGGTVLLWLACLGYFAYLIVHTPYFHGFYQASLPTFGSGGVLWASLTLALLTLPVVIVATEEALAAVPNSMREGSYGCGASKWQTIRRIVLPRALPGIMTGMILAIARGAGEVAPLMLVGAKQSAPKLPFDGVFPYLHPSRSFMHLGYHIYDVGFHSPDSEAAKPMVYTATLLLIAIVALLNVAAVWLRSRLRRRYMVGQF